jgi:phosphate transport system substrate-binding protein
LRTSRSLTVAAICGALAFGVAACGDDEEESGSGGGGAAAETGAEESGTDLSSLSGTVRIDGSSTVQPLAEAGAELFQEEAPNVRITVGGAGTGDGFERFCRGEIVVANASRGIEADEYEACKAENIDPVQVQVGLDGLTIVANKNLAVPNDCITTDQLKELLAPDSKVRNYSELGEGWPDQEVSFFTPGTESGTYDYFTEEVLETDAEQRTQNVQTSADDNQIVTGISGTEGALGYVGFAFAEENKDNLKELQVDGGDGCVAPSVETIASGEYKPLSRPLYMYPTVETAKQPEVKEFINFILANNQEVVEAAGYVPLTDELKTEAQGNLDNATPVEAPAAE